MVQEEIRHDPERRVPALAQPPCQADVVRVHVGVDDVANGLRRDPPAARQQVERELQRMQREVARDVLEVLRALARRLLEALLQTG